MPDHGDAHAWSLPHGRPRSERLTRGGRRAFQTMMDAVATIPPFETFYGEHAEEVFACSAGGSDETVPRMRSRRRSCGRFARTTG